MCVCLKQLAELVQCDITEVIVDDITLIFLISVLLTSYRRE